MRLTHRRRGRVATIVLLVIGILGCRGGLSDWKVSEGQLLPDFELRALDGSTFDFRTLKANAYVITRFATWCPPCRVELRELESRVWKPLREKGVMVIGVSSGEEPEKVKEFVDREGLSFPVLLDPDGEFARTVGGNSIPRLMILDRERRIMHLKVGYYEPEFAKTVEQVKALASGPEAR
ncbi:MAG: peroxiredoxin family protein [Candidatus Sumerlaeaceae bacterium]